MIELDRLVTLCRETAARYQAAAQAVGDPGLRLQFNHLAAAREAMVRNLASVRPAAATAGDGTGDGAGDGGPPKGVARPNRRRLEPAADAATLPPGHLRALVHSLRDHDELILAECRRARNGGTGDQVALGDGGDQVALGDGGDQVARHSPGRDGAGPVAPQPAARVLEDVVTSLAADVERLRILETLTGTGHSHHG